MDNPELISILKTGEDISEIYLNIKKGIALIGAPSVSPEDIVVIKLNLCCIKGPETGATTDPRVVEALIRYLKDDLKLTKIYIAEADGTQLLADMAFKLLGFQSLAERLGVNLVNLSKTSASPKTFKDNVILKEIKIPEIVEKAKLLISVPKIKTHTLCKVSGVMKNQYGCTPYARKKVYHYKVHDCIVDLTAAFKPNLIVVDGLVAMEGNGPVDGIPVKMNTIIIGKDPVAVDHLLSRIIGVNPDNVNYITKARNRGIGTTNYKTVGVDPAEIERKFKFPPRRRNFYGIFSSDYLTL